LSSRLANSRTVPPLEDSNRARAIGKASGVHKPGATSWHFETRILVTCDWGIHELDVLERVALIVVRDWIGRLVWVRFRWAGNSWDRADRLWSGIKRERHGVCSFWDEKRARFLLFLI
jgi:hypothetical protein